MIIGALRVRKESTHFAGTSGAGFCRWLSGWLLYCVCSAKKTLQCDKGVDSGDANSPKQTTQATRGESTTSAHTLECTRQAWC
jgi:hypothetical protein